MNNEGNGNVLALILFGLVGMLAIVWLNFSIPIISFLLTIAEFCLQFIGFTSEQGIVGEFIAHYLVPGANSQTIEAARQELYRSDPRYMGLTDTLIFTDFIGQVIRGLLLPIMLFCMWKIWKKQAAFRLRKVYDIYTLAKHSESYNPHLKPILRNNLLKINPDIGMTAREKMPIRVAVLEGLVSVHDVDYLGNNISTLLTPTFDKKLANKDGYLYIEDELKKGISTLHERCYLHDDKVAQYFTSQLGKKYSGHDNMSPAYKAMYAVFICFLQGDDKGGKTRAFALLDELNLGFNEKKVRSGNYIPMTTVNKIIADYANTDAVNAVEKVHYYELTLLAGLLQAARTKGKLWVGKFWWIKLVDRVLWYTLHGEGGLCGWTEAAGPRAHKLAEESVNHGLAEPFVDTAVTAFREFMVETEGWVPLDSAESARRQS